MLYRPTDGAVGRPVSPLAGRGAVVRLLALGAPQRPCRAQPVSVSALQKRILTIWAFLNQGVTFTQERTNGEKMKAFLILEDGHVFTGKRNGSSREIVSEIVFNTSMTGYLEVLTDPSYSGQAVVMTYPLIGNYGICKTDYDATK